MYWAVCKFTKNTTNTCQKKGMCFLALQSSKIGGCIVPFAHFPKNSKPGKPETNLEKLVRGSCPGPPRGTNFDTFSRKSKNMERRGRVFLRFGPISFFASVWTGL